MKYVIKSPAGGQPAGSYNVMDSGAHGNGTDDDRLHILDAITAAAGGTVYFPAGEYLCATTLVVPESTVMAGPTVAAIPINVAKTDGSGCNTPTAWIKGTVEWTSHSSFSDLKIGPASAGTNAVYNANNTDHSTSFTRCQFRGGGYSGSHYDPVWMGKAVSDITYTDCNFERSLLAYTGSWIPTNVYIFSSMVSPSIDNVLFVGCHFGISNGVAAGASGFNFCVFETDHTEDPYVATHGYRNINFEYCLFESSNMEQLDYSGSNLAADPTVPNSGYSYVLGCVFKGDGVTGEWFSSIVCEGGSGYYEISECTFYRGKGASISMDDNELSGLNQYINFHDNVTDATNVVLDTGITHYAFEYINCTSNHNTVTGNTVTMLGQTCCVSLHGDYNTVTGNTLTIASNGWYTVDITAGATGNVVTGNTMNKPIRDNGTNSTVTPNP